MPEALKETSRKHKLNVFVSYSRHDIAFADELVAGLQFAGFETMIDRHSIKPGEDWHARLGGLMLAADTIVFVISPDSIASDVCAWEVDEARRLSKRIIPLLWRQVDFASAPLGLSALNAIPFTEGRVFSGLNQLVEALNSDLEWLREHTRIGQKAQEWEAGKRGAEWLLRGSALKLVQAWLGNRPETAPPPTEQQLAYIKASEEEEAKLLDESRARLQEQVEAKAASERVVAARRIVQRTIAGLVAAVILSLVASGAGLYAFQKRGEAEAASKDAEAARQLALAARDDSLLIQSKFVSDLSRRETEQGDAVTGVLLALEALPNKRSSREIERERPLLPLADERLQQAQRAVRESLILAHPVVVTGVASIDADRIATAAFDGAVRVWNTDTGELMQMWKGHAGSIWSISSLPERKLFASGGADGDIRLWDSTSGAQKAHLQGKWGAVTAVALTADGRSAIVGYADNKIRIWSINGQTATALDGTPGPIHAIAISPSGAEFASAGNDGITRIWAMSGKQVLASEGESGAAYAVAFLPTHDVVVGSADHTARVWNRKPDAAPTLIKGHAGAVLAVAVATYQAGNAILTASLDKSVRMWRSDFSEVLVLRGHTEPVRALAVLPGARIATASYDKTVRIWDLPREAQPGDRRKRDTSEQASGTPQTATPAAATASAKQQDRIEQAIGRVRRCLTPEQREAYNLAPSGPSWCFEGGKWPFDARTQFAAGNDHLRLLNSAAADVAFAKAVSLDPTIAEDVAEARKKNRVVQAEQLIEEGRYAEAIKLISDATPAGQDVELSSLKAEAENALAWKLLHANAAGDALVHAENAVVARPDSAVFLDTRGHVRLALGQNAGACSDFDGAIAKGLSYAGVYWGRGACAQALGRETEAVSNFRKAAAETASHDPFAAIAGARARDALARPATKK